ncbi:MAG: hypothetical protein EAZ70_02885 [Runella slithyformis]|jgi:hypothetical protein|nr:MAG: hypothetical protein EAY79_02820 [Runella slithyformis]TAF29187.1 MAG: hypothetical protein EAZ70_02885 [Runella slithyformis]TAF48087.1 MAG: hypothetical protein EAZ63_06290 [Runella slithyformis]TAF82878.1 MAG: hypothetical protein EAZ50_02840 [Runella slithyformis]
MNQIESYPYQIEELYRNAKGCTYQCDLTNRVVLQFGAYVSAFKFHDFRSFCQKVNSVNIHEMIFNLSDEYDFQAVQTPSCQQTYRLSLCELVQLRDLLNGTKFTLELNSLLHERIYNVNA